jgi:hypothetical protein
MEIVKCLSWNGLSPLGSQACPAKMAQPMWAFWPKAEIEQGTFSPLCRRCLIGKIRPVGGQGSTGKLDHGELIDVGRDNGALTVVA